jgi:hypothetical protein
MSRYLYRWFSWFIVLFATSAVWAVEGKVVDAKTGAGIADATITDGDRMVTSDSDGHFQVNAAGNTVFVRAPGYRAAQYLASDLNRTGGPLFLTPFTPKALYLSVYGVGSKALRGAALDLIRKGTLNALVIDIKGDRGLVPYPSEIPLAKVNGSRAITTISDLSAFVNELHSAGIYAIARIVVFKDTPLATTRPDLAVKYANGQLFHDREGLAWTDPFQAEVRDYNIAIAVEAARAGFDEIQFDYVRFPDVSRQLRFAQPTTEASRTKAIEDFLMEARHQLAPFNVYLAVDIFGYVCWNKNDTGIGQQLEDIIKIVDYISPMLYPSCFQYGIPGYSNSVAYPYEIIHNTLENAQKRLHVSPMRFRPWLQAFKDYAFDRRAFDTEEISAQIRAAEDFGSDGWMLWNPRNSYSDIGLDH